MRCIGLIAHLDTIPDFSGENVNPTLVPDYDGGVVALGESSGQFVVNAYPVSVHPWDIVVIFFTVIAVGWLAVWYPVRYFSKRLID